MLKFISTINKNTIFFVLIYKIRTFATVLHKKKFHIIFRTVAFLLVCFVIGNAFNESLSIIFRSHEHSEYCTNYQGEGPFFDHDHHTCKENFGLLYSQNDLFVSLLGQIYQYKNGEFRVLNKTVTKFDKFKFNPKDPPIV
jgi:hypothetical protein